MNAYYTAPAMSGLDFGIFLCLIIIAGSLFWIALHHQMIPIYDEDEEFYDEEEDEDDR